MGLEDRLAAGACPAPGEPREKGDRGEKSQLRLLPHTGTCTPSESGCHAAVFTQEESGTKQECAGRGCGSLEPAWTGGRGLGFLSWARGQGRPGGCYPDPAASLDAGTALSPGRLRTLDSSTGRGLASGQRGER